MMRTNTQARRFLRDCADRIGGVKPLARQLDRNHVTLRRLLGGKLVKPSTARAFHRILRRLGYRGETGLETRVLPLAPETDDEQEETVVA